jgi:hypothetical protein
MRTTRIAFGVVAIVSGFVVLIVELVSPAPWMAEIT